MELRAMIEGDLDTCKRGPPLIKLLGYENLENAVCGLGRRQWRTNTNIHTHTHTHTECRP